MSSTPQILGSPRVKVCFFVTVFVRLLRTGKAVCGSKLQPGLASSKHTVTVRYRPLSEVGYTVFTVLKYSVQCTVYSVQRTAYSVQCTVYSVQCTVYSVQCTVYCESQPL